MAHPLPRLLVRLGLGLLACLLAAIAPAREAAETSPTDRTDLVAYYYPWYDQGDWSRHPYVGTPTLGLYGTDDPDAAEQQIRWCADYGIDVLCCSWWGEASQTDQHLQAGLLAAENAGDIRFCIFYESPKLDTLDGTRDLQIDFASPAVAEQFIADMKYLAKTYFNKDNYYRIDGKPVVGVYLTRVFQHLDAAAMHRLRDAIGTDIFFIGDEAYFGGQDKPRTARHGPGVFDAYSAYNMHTDARIHDGEPARDYLLREAWPVYQNWISHPDTWFMPNVMPSYKDFRGHHTLTGTPAQFQQALAEAEQLAGQDPAAKHRVIFITSFNEWWEGSTLEPTEEYGLGYLEAIKRWRDE